MQFTKTYKLYKKKEEMNEYQREHYEYDWQEIEDPYLKTFIILIHSILSNSQNMNEIAKAKFYEDDIFYQSKNLNYPEFLREDRYHDLCDLLINGFNYDPQRFRNKVYENVPLEIITQCTLIKNHKIFRL